VKFDIISCLIGLVIGAIGTFLIVKKDPAIVTAVTSTLASDVADLKKDVAALKAKG
jgi:hypothetical protein